MRAYPVLRVLDDCTIRVRVDEREQQVTLAGTALPTDEAAHSRLRQFLTNLLAGESVFIQYEPAAGDDRPVPRAAHLFRAPDGLFVNLEAVRQGYARAQSEPPSDHLKLLRYYEQRAREARKGIWAPQSPPEIQSDPRSTENASPTAAGETIVYVTKSGKKYHREDCYHLRKSSRAITLREAVQKGYTPCAHCKPPVLKEP